MKPVYKKLQITVQMGVTIIIVRIFLFFPLLLEFSETKSILS